MKRAIYTFALTMLLAGSPALAAKPSSGGGGSTTTTGIDVSYPQCGSTLPMAPAFAVVGVNGGKASSFNSCFGTEWTWAASATGGTNQPKAAMYVNTGNPGDVLAQYSVADWPTSSDPAVDPYGTCVGIWTDDLPCSWEYGYERAQGDAGYAGGGAQLWWLDVETSNSWTSDPAKNRATLEGMVYGFTKAGGTVGLYSASYQWSSIAGSVPAGTPLYGLNEWRPGAKTLKAAIGNCSLSPFTGGGHVTMTQYSTSLDYDYSCIN